RVEAQPLFVVRRMCGIDDAECQWQVTVVYGVHDRFGDGVAASPGQSAECQQSHAVAVVEPAIAGRSAWGGRQDARVGVVADLLGRDASRSRQVDRSLRRLRVCHAYLQYQDVKLPNRSSM